LTTASPEIEAEQSKTRPRTDWHAFDRIYCISLNNRPDRLETARRQLKSVGLDGLVEFMQFDKDPTNSERGIFESHMACLRAGLAAGAERILIFEDDILFSRFSQERLRRAIYFMNSNKDWRLFFFGCFVNYSRKTAFRSIVKVGYRCCAHGYVVNGHFARELVEVPWREVAYDDFLRSYGTEGAYAIYPGFAFQSASPTDNDKLRRVDRARRLFGGLRRLQRWNEFSTRKFKQLVIGHILFAITLAVILLHHFGLPGK
jgi:GR25 family glycosyltransferase involved in LPS biosynthesis